MIKYFNRKTKSYEVEKVAGNKYLEWTYSSPIGVKFLELFIKKKLFTKLYGQFCDSSWSKKNIQKFIDNFNIDEKHFKYPKSTYKNFNNFFTRELIEEARPIDPNSDVLISPADGRLLAYDNIDINNLIQVKGFTYNLKELIKNDALAKNFSGGICLIFRLAPIDYHRFHFVDDGICEKTHKIPGKYYSVNPIALNKIPKLFCENKREYSLFKSNNFGNLLYVDVGATCVGAIVQTYTPDKKVKKGEEKGFFKFGGSTVILFLEKGKVTIDPDIIEQTKMGFECKVNMGERIGIKL
ncbi:phosphatidylserine decarboxylase proenzyme [Clostridium homopropionicum DSM 5847]|uniref:Phosphatidylserine decarboxylase proenzyme n=1 Tax=Clostridium homopropionicum DSM 5847 TaxID=1121318 RepID=A0A0L6Z977_9CLOT|nr:phosphatidylserine decarboxylase [Clostridium homopropionicum]KOA19520.1 phosphatidylserine decarboxylase proenzyme [Clostridium homopropionicum DSM 5847]SFG92741.1 phosphatidylserine decarboxylase [Clostridium homopropionicum]